jgi:DNA-binding Lrp family transcriptional regulator
MLDDVDRRLIELLSVDGRLSNRSLAAEIGLTEVTVATRLRRLTANNVLHVTAIFDWAVAGYEWYVIVQITCRDRSPTEVAADIGKLESSYYTSLVFGEVDLIAAFLLADRAELQRLVEIDLPRVEGLHALTLHLATVQHVNRWSTSTFPQNRTPSLRFPKPPVDLDDLDDRLITCLVEDGRQSNREIGRQLDVSEGTVRLRIRRLIDAGLVRITAVVDPVAVGSVSTVAYCFAKVDRHSHPEVVDLIAAVDTCWHLTSIVGQSDLLGLLVCPDRPSLIDSVMRIRGLDGVVATSTFEVIGLANYDHHWARFLD